MIKTNRYNNLNLLKIIGLPTPDFIKISSKTDIENNELTGQVPYGWTIRTCKYDGEDEFSLFYKNNVKYDELIQILKDRLNRFNNEFYIVYPSWDFSFSVNIVKSELTYIIEGKYGTQKSISIGSELPDFSIIYSLITKRYDHNFNDYEMINKVKKIINMLEKVDLFDEFYTEVAVTKNGELFFYELWNINDIKNY
jgi:hypothetical protein